ncbi:NAD(P)H-binding protein [Pseudomonas sp. B21-056]|jgi:putative NADH-flavin reductase|uniref:NAD(P)-dependent oxidoreductase n=1 Tax=Pseudomonas sp. B21-056 TaxID=2895495 RepID=UPI00222F6AB5|nr:NAD(P)H-binding protein [Pseudomonas sp. B21-056]UZE23837.1 NAD(P)H-binding protein [Pseudomonas sp. B21-056]
MKIALIAPTGKIGSAIAKEALCQGHDVIGIVRSARKAPEGLEAVHFKVADITDTTSFANAIKGADVLASAYGAHGNEIDTVIDAAKSIVAAAREARIKRIIVVGGAGSLEVAPGSILVNAPYFPVDYRPYGLAHDNAFKIIRSCDDLDWTFFSPAAEIGPGEKLGNYTVAAKTLQKNAEGLSKIFYPDYAEAFIAEISQCNFIKNIMTISYR